MLFVWITSYLFAVVFGGILTLCWLFWAFSPKRRLKKLVKIKAPDEVEPLAEPDIPLPEGMFPQP